MKQNAAIFLIDYSVTGGVERVNAVLLDLFKKHGIYFKYIISLRSSKETPSLNYLPELECIVMPADSSKNLRRNMKEILTQNCKVYIVSNSQMPI